MLKNVSFFGREAHNMCLSLVHWMQHLLPYYTSALFNLSVGTVYCSCPECYVMCLCILS